VPSSNRLARLIRERRPAVGMWINLSDPGVAQIAALAGYDWVMIDTEHNPFTESQVQGLLHALGGFDVTAIVRVRANREEHVKWILDTGAGGVVIPSIRDTADARQAVEISKYFPLGRRGYGPNRASHFWTRGKEYTANANQETLLICQIELASAVAEVDQICQVPGIDGVWIGPTDLAQSLGHLGDAQHPEVQAAIERVIESANRHGLPWGIPTANVQDYETYVQRAGVLMTLGSDSRLLWSGASEMVSKARALPAGT
jgi:2-keto-3-deoxy-L-rhamnonate aldolase RhmA